MMFYIHTMTLKPAVLCQELVDVVVLVTDRVLDWSWHFLRFTILNLKEK